MPASRSQPVRRLVLCVSILALAGSSARGQGCQAIDLTGILQTGKFYPLNEYWLYEAPQQGTDIGRSVDIEGRACAVGMPNFDFVEEHWFGSGNNMGYASWLTLEPRFPGARFAAYPPPFLAYSAPGNQLGYSVCLDSSPELGQSLQYAASAPGYSSQRGTVFIARLAWSSAGSSGSDHEWDFEQLTAPDAAPNDRFGASLALVGDTLVAGAPQDDDLGSNSGSVYVFRDDAFEAKLLASDGAAGDRFGSSVSTSDGLVLVGAPYHDVSRGAVYAYARDAQGSWYQDAVLTAWDATPYDRFGASLAFQDGLLVVGSPNDDDGGTNAGAVYAYERLKTGWVSRGKVLAPDPATNAGFGSAVDTQDRRVLVGARNARDANGAMAGKAYLYNLYVPPPPWNGSPHWSLQRELGPGLPGSKFGDAVALDGTHAIVGAPKATVSHLADPGVYPQQTGCAHVFDLEYEPASLLEDPSYGGWSTQAFRSEDVGARVCQSGATLTLEAQGLDVFVDVPPIGVGPHEQLTAYDLRWYKDGIALTDSGAISGTTTDTLTIDPVADQHEGRYELRGADLAAASHGLCTGEVRSGPFDVVVNDSYPVSQLQLLAGDGAAYDRFGVAVASDGERMAVGAPGDDDQGSNSGSAYVWRAEAGAWVFEAKLLPPLGSTGDGFGQALDIDGDVLVAGSPGDDGVTFDTGSVSVFRHNGSAWVLEQKLTAPDPGFGARFGFAVAVSRTRIVVGAPYAGSADEGAAYVFDLGSSGWELVHARHGVHPNGHLGWSVDARDHRVAVGEPGAPNGGQVQAFADLTRWSFEGVLLGAFLVLPAWPVGGTILTGSAASSADHFGEAVALGGEYLLVGAPQDDDRGLNSGAAYRFPFDMAEFEYGPGEKFWPTYSLTDDGFGRSVAADGQVCVVGAANGSGVSGAAGIAYLFSELGGVWQERGVISPGSAAGDEFGASIALVGETVLAGADGADVLGVEAGAAWLYDL